MKVLWICNVPIGGALNQKGVTGGWLEGALNSVSSSEEYKVAIAFPFLGQKNLKKGQIKSLSLNYYGFFQPKVFGFIPTPNRKKLSRKTFKQIQVIIDKEKPDLLHVFGTEFAHSRIAIECFNNPDKTVIHIQGMVSVYAKHCLLGFPFIFRHLFVPSSLARGTLATKARELKKAGKNEIAAIKHVQYVMGRTEWDEACTKAINPLVNHIHCGEILRPSFYKEASQWKYEDCKKHSIYFSQSSSQVKGLHLVLPILSELIRKYPDTHLYVGGNSPVGSNTFMGIVKRSPLGWYLKHQIKKYKLNKHVTFLGVQNEQQVVENLKNAHVFLSASLIENSPNSVGEAMVVGTPVVSSDVGGVKDFIKHRENGYIYPVDEPYMIPYYIGKIFDDTELAERFSIVGREIGREKYSGESNGEIIISTYKKMIGNL